MQDIDRLTAEGTIDLDPPWKERKKQIFPHAFARTINPEVDPDGAYKEMNTLLRQLATEFQEAVKAGHEGSGVQMLAVGRFVALATSSHPDRRCLCLPQEE